MILADKIIKLRKENGWSQEELAEKMHVSRQAVSKWEGAQTVPDIEKILQLSKLFDVTTDALLKDEIEIGKHTDDTSLMIKRITLPEANNFLNWRKTASILIAAATFLCILSVIPLFILAAASEEIPSFPLSANLASSIGLIALFIIVSGAVAIYIYCGFKNTPYEFLDKESFSAESGVTELAKEQQEKYRSAYVRCTILGTCICVLSPIPLFIGAFTENAFFTVMMLAVTMLLAGIGTMLFITTGVRWASTKKLLKEGEYSEKEKQKSSVRENVGGVYWIVVAAGYLGWSFATGRWHFTWIVWPIAGVLFVGVMVICNLLIEKEK